MTSSINTDKLYSVYIYFIIVIKIFFILFSVTDKYFNMKGTTEVKVSKFVALWKERFEFIFIITMSLLCIGLFNPWKKGRLDIDPLTKFLLFVYGIIIFLKADWGILFSQAKEPWFQKLKSVL